MIEKNNIMAVLGFHFSGVYKKSLLNGSKTATIMAGRHFFRKGEIVQLYLSNKSNLFDGRVEKRIGQAEIKEMVHCRVRDLTEVQAKTCGHSSLAELKQALKKWYGVTDNSSATYIRFKLEVYN